MRTMTIQYTGARSEDLNKRIIEFAESLKGREVQRFHKLVQDGEFMQIVFILEPKHEREWR